ASIAVIGRYVDLDRVAHVAVDDAGGGDGGRADRDAGHAALVVDGRSFRVGGGPVDVRVDVTVRDDLDRQADGGIDGDVDGRVALVECDAFDGSDAGRVLGSGACR